MNYTRDGIQEKLISLGAHPSGAVSKNTDYLIVGKRPATSSRKRSSWVSRL
jgi:DNA ligase (NAD+)